jgi:hypothetical protein
VNINSESNAVTAISNATVATVSQHEFTDPTTYEISKGDIVTQEIGEYCQQPPAFNFGLGNDTNLNIYGEFFGTGMLLIPHVLTYNPGVQNTSFMDLLMDDEVDFDFGFDSGFTDNSSDAGGLPQLPPYISTAASSSGEDLSTYDYGGIGSETYSSSEGESGHGASDSSIYSLGHWNNINTSSYYSEDIDAMDDNPDMILPMPRIPTSSPPGSSPVQPQLPLVDTEAYILTRSLKRPRAPVAADLDTANILPSEHRRKRMKPARVTHMESA